MAVKLRVLFLLVILSASLLAQSSTDAAQLNGQINGLAGIEMTFRNPPPNIAKIVLTPIETGAVADRRKFVRYSLGVTGLPQDKPYILMMWDIGSTSPRIFINEVRIDAKGILHCGDQKDSCQGNLPGSQVEIGLGGMLGQPRRFVLTGSDKKPVALGEAVPFPAIGTDKQCSTEAVLLLPNGAATLILGKGFGHGEAVRFSSSSPYGEELESSSSADQDGNISRVVLPFVKGRDEGKTSVTFSGSNCRTSTTFNWGVYREEQAQTAPAAK